MRTVGVLALQGAVCEHITQLQAIGAKGVCVKNAHDLSTVDALILPGGESTAISRLIQKADLYTPIQNFAKTRPVLGTCAGLILCSTHVPDSENKVKPLGLIDITTTRNGFGRQVDSFETHLFIDQIGKDIPAVFIRAPYIESVGEKVHVLAKYDDKVVMAEQEHILVCSFHPELTSDTRILQYFLQKI